MPTTDQMIVEFAYIAKTQGLDAAKKRIKELTEGTERAQTSWEKFQKRFSRFNDSAQRVGGAIGKLGRGLLMLKAAAIGAGYGFARLAGNILNASDEIETTKLGFAALIQQIGGAGGGPLSNFQTSLMVSGALVSKMRQDAAASVGSFKDYTGAFRQIYIPLAQAGASLNDTTELIKSVVAVQKLSGAVPNSVAGDVKQLLLGQFTDKMIQTPVLKKVGKEVANLVNQGKKLKAFQILKEALTLSPEALKAIGKTYGAQLDTIKDKWLSIKQVIGKQLAPVVLDWFEKIGKIIDRNQDKIKEFADNFASWVGKAGEKVAGVVDSIRRNFDRIILTVKWLAGIWIGTKLVGALSTVLTLVGKINTGLASVGAGGGLSKALGGIGVAGLGAAALAYGYQSDKAGYAAAGFNDAQASTLALTGPAKGLAQLMFGKKGGNAFYEAVKPGSTGPQMYSRAPGRGLFDSADESAWLMGKGGDGGGGAGGPGAKGLGAIKTVTAVFNHSVFNIQQEFESQAPDEVAIEMIDQIRGTTATAVQTASIYGGLF